MKIKQSICGLAATLALGNAAVPLTKPKLIASDVPIVSTTSEPNKDYAVVYALGTIPIFENTSLTSAVKSYLSFGEKIYVYDEIVSENYERYLISENGYVRHTDITFNEEDVRPVVQPVSYTGPHLSPTLGTIQGPSGKETYYNLNMVDVVIRAHQLGYEGEYWIRNDGVKMLGDYIICACAFSIRPIGTLVETSLGTGICLDTGSFAYSDPYLIDISVNW
jgi:hypothetical protein